jgi:glycosyltransferase involved in cell wall biosynthesis
MITIGVLAVARQRHGGTLLYTLSMLEALRRLPTAYRTVVYTAADNAEYDGVGIPIVRLPRPATMVARWLAGRSVFRGADLLLAPVYSPALLLGGLPFAFTLHDLQEKHYPQNFGRATRWWREWTNRTLLRRAARTVCESQFVKEDIARFYGVEGSTVEVIAAPPISLLRDGATGPEHVAAVRARLSLPACYAFYPAQFWPHKNHHRLVEAFARVVRRHPECHLVLTGKQRDEFESVFRRVDELGLRGHVHHIGYVEQSDLAALYRGATLAVVPTLFESISIPVFEAFSIGTPVCASRVVALPEQIGDAGLLFDPRSPEDIADKICALLADPALRRDLVERGRRRMAAVTHDDYAARLRGLVDNIATGASP